MELCVLGMIFLHLSSCRASLYTAIMDNYWALGPQQMCWGIEPGRAGMQPAKGHRGPEKTCKVTTDGNVKNEDSPPSQKIRLTHNAATFLEVDLAGRLLKGTKKKGRKTNVFYICLACIASCIPSDPLKG